MVTSQKEHDFVPALPVYFDQARWNAPRGHPSYWRPNRRTPTYGDAEFQRRIVALAEKLARDLRQREVGVVP